jgi:DNA-binding Lrp family transcriptional regulator
MSIKLDIKDRKILAQLDLNARTHISTIAKNVGLSRQVTEYRIKRLEQKKILIGYYTILNTSKLGYLYCRIHLNLRSTSSKDEKEIISKIKEIENVIWLSQQQGEKWEIAIVALVKNFLELDKIYKEIIFEHNNYIEKSDVSVATKIYHYKNKYLFNKKLDEIPYCVIGEEIDNYILEKNQRKILSVISDNARLSLVEISKQTNLDVKTISNNIKKLITDKIILEFKPIINTNLLGLYHYHCFFTFDNMSFEKQKKIINYIKNHQYTLYTTLSIGFAGLEFDILLKKNLDLIKFVKKFKKQFPNTLRNFYSEMAYKIHKNTYHF